MVLVYGGGGIMEAEKKEWRGARSGGWWTGHGVREGGHGVYDINNAGRLR